jgi:putative oxidoreductase
MGPRASIVALLELAARLAVAGVFLWAGISKALDPARFAEAIHRYDLVSYPTSAAMALYLPWLEILAAAGLMLHRTCQASVMTLAILATVFICAMASAWMRGLDIACGCFVADRAATGLAWPIARIALILAVLLVLAIRLWRREQARPAAES